MWVWCECQYSVRVLTWFNISYSIHTTLPHTVTLTVQISKWLIFKQVIALFSMHVYAPLYIYMYICIYIYGIFTFWTSFLAVYIRLFLYLVYEIVIWFIAKYRLKNKIDKWLYPHFLECTNHLCISGPYINHYFLCILMLKCIHGLAPRY